MADAARAVMAAARAAHRTIRFTPLTMAGEAGSGYAVTGYSDTAASDSIEVQSTGGNGRRLGSSTEIMVNKGLRSG
jgi:hypothetical protein